MSVFSPEPFPVISPAPAHSRRFVLSVIFSPGKQLRADLARVIDRFCPNARAATAVSVDNTEVRVDLPGVDLYQAERMTRLLIGMPGVNRLHGQGMSENGSEVFAISLFSKRS